MSGASKRLAVTHQELADVFRDGHVAGFRKAIDALEMLPEDMAVCRAIAALREVEPVMVGALIHAFEQWAASE